MIKDSYIRIRLTTSEKQKIKALAKELGKTMTNLVIEKVLNTNQETAKN
jgi:uncharacterized protein (DUF1778 family)